MEQSLQSTRSTSAQTDVGRVKSYHLDGTTLTLQTATAHVYVTMLAPDLVRVQLVPEGASPSVVLDSFAVVKRDWPPVDVVLQESADKLTMRVNGTHPGGDAGADVGAEDSGGVDRSGDIEVVREGPAASDGTGAAVEIALNPLRLRIVRADGSVAAACAAGGGLAWDVDGVHWRLAAPKETRYYGFGQKLGFLDKRGRQMSIWATDEPLHILDNDELYQAIPFFMTLEPGDGRSAGVFLDCTARVTYDVAKSDPDVVAMSGAAETLDAYVFAGPGPKDVISRYTELTGRMELPPLWGLGYQQCRYSYYPEERVREVAAEMRARNIPCDVIYLDIDYMDGYRVFTWDNERFPDPKRLVSDLAADGFRTVVIVDPGVKLDGRYDVFREGVEEGHFICHPDGELFVGTVWPGRTVFPDFLRKATREWWGELHRELVQDIGVAGIWNDMNEPSCFARNTLPDEVLQGEDGAQVPHRSVHNVYGQTMAMATYDAWRRMQPEKRPFLLTRSGYAGVQRYAAVWMGDNHSWWEHLLMAMPVCLGMGLSGVPFVGTDIGGFQQDSNGELFARWMQMGALMPFCRNHSAKYTADQEPWSFGPEVEAISREFLQLRYRLLPFLYNLFYDASQTGLPVMRPLVLEYPDDPNAAHLSDQFLLGCDLLVCPVYQPGAAHRMVYLPPGSWVDFWSGERLSGGRFIVAEAPLERLPLYVRDGAVIPMEPPVNHTGERDGKHLVLHVYAGADGRLELYEDAGEGYGYKGGEWAQTVVDVRRSENGVAVTVGDPAGGFRPPREHVTVHVHMQGLAAAVTPIVRVNGEVAAVERGDGVLGADAPGAPGDVIVTVPTPNAAGFTLTVE